MTSPVRGPAPDSQRRWPRAGAGLAAEPRNGWVRGERSGLGHGDRDLHGLPPSQPPAEPTSRRLPPVSPQEEPVLLAALAGAAVSRSAVRYRGFVLLPQPDLGWLVRPERSPMTVLPFRTPPISLCDVKALVDWRLDQVLLQAGPRR